MRAVIFEVPHWNLKERARRTPLCPVRFHGARHCHALERAAERARRASERRDHAHLRAASRDAGNPRGVAPKNRRDGEAVRLKFPAVFATIRRMLETPVPAKKPIGFHAKLELTKNAAQTNRPSINSRK